MSFRGESNGDPLIDFFSKGFAIQKSYQTFKTLFNCFNIIQMIKTIPARTIDNMTWITVG